MRDIVLAALDKTRPVVVLTRDLVRPVLAWVTVVPCTSTIWGLESEVRLGPRNGLDHECVASMDTIQTVPTSALGRQVGFLFDDQEADLTRAVVATFDLRLG